MHVLLDLLVPRFITEDVAIDGNAQNGYSVVCCMEDVDPGEQFSGIATIRCFNLFGFALFAKQIGDIRPWVNPHNA